MSASEERSRLTVAMIVRNEAEAIELTLRSIREIADEIVVLDTGSSDDTPAIARRHGGVVVERPWDDSFAAARNACFERCCGDWVLWLDAGETVSAAEARELRVFLDTRAEPIKAYMLLVKSPRAANEIAGECKGMVRLVPNHPALRFSGRIRECLLQSLAENDIVLEALPHRIHRTAREHDPQRKSQRARRNLRLTDLEIAERGPLAHLLNCQGEALATLGDRRRALELHRTALEHSDPGSTDMLEAYYGLLTALEGEDSTRQAQITVCLDAIESFPLDAQLLCAMGGYLQSQGHNELALRAYQTAWRFGRVNPQVWHLDELSCIAANCLATTLELAGRDDEARQVLERTLAEHPHATRVRRHLLELHVKHGRRDEALAEFNQLPSNTPHREALRSAVRGACLAAKRNWLTARTYLDTAFQAGCRDLICLRWLVVTLLALGEIETSRLVIAAWRGIDPDGDEAEQYLREATGAELKSTSQNERRLRVDRGPASSSTAPSPNAARTKSDVNESRSS